MAIYLDHNATTQPHERVVEAMLPYLQQGFGNPSSLHRWGRQARAALDQAREQVAALVGAHPSQVVFTSGGTEANNSALKGVAARQAPGRIAIGATEHASVRAPAAALTRQGWALDTLAVNDQGVVEADALAGRLAPGTRLVSLMWANNESGAVQDVAVLAEAVRGSGALFHTDAVQAAGKLAVDFRASGAHLMSLSAHKLYGPKGVGALVVDKAVDMEALLHGGGQERERRGGTENLPGIVGFGMAAELALGELASRHDHLLALRRRLEAGLKAALPECEIFAQRVERLPNTVFFALPGLDGETLLLELDRRGFALSSGAACGSAHTEPSHVLEAMGVPAELARGSLRVSLGRSNTEQEVDALVDALREVSTRLKAMSASAWA